MLSGEENVLQNKLQADHNLDSYKTINPIKNIRLLIPNVTMYITIGLVAQKEQIRS
jgi:hypothetical protein